MALRVGLRFECLVHPFVCYIAQVCSKENFRCNIKRACVIRVQGVGFPEILVGVTELVSGEFPECGKPVNEVVIGRKLKRLS